MLHDSYLLDAVRTPRGQGKNGALHGVHPQELLAQTLDALRGRTALDPRDVDDVVIPRALNADPCCNRSSPAGERSSSCL